MDDNERARQVVKGFYGKRLTYRRINAASKTLLATIIAMLRLIARIQAKGQLRFDLGR